MNLSVSQFKRYSYLEGFFFALMVATSESYTLYYFIKQGISTSDSALLTSLPLALASLVQLFCPRLIKDNRLAMGLVSFLFIQVLGLILITYNVWHPEMGPAYVLSGLCLYWIGAQNAGPLWLDWTSRFIPYSEFHLFLGKRNTLITTATLITGLIASLLINNTTMFRYLFLAGLIARCASLTTQYLMTRKFKISDHPMPEIKKEETHTPQNQNLGKIILIFFFWIALFRFAVSLCSPFFLTHMIHELRLLPYEYIFMINVPLIGKMLFLSNWAKASKGKRSFWGMQISVLFISFLPSIWNFSPNFWYLISAQIFSGILWAGHEISNTLMVQETSYARARGLVAINHAMINTFCLGGSLLGAQILGNQNRYNELFTISTVARLTVAILFITYVHKYSGVALKYRAFWPYLSKVLGLHHQQKNLGQLISFSRKLIAKN